MVQQLDVLEEGEGVVFLLVIEQLVRWEEAVEMVFSLEVP
jgi:hypothetical protein